MARNPQTADALAVLKAAHSYGFKPHHMTNADDGVVLRKPGKAELFLSYQSARQWAEETGQ